MVIILLVIMILRGEMDMKEMLDIKDLMLILK